MGKAEVLKGKKWSYESKCKGKVYDDALKIRGHGYTEMALEKA